MRQAFEKVTKDELGGDKSGMSDSELNEIKEMRDTLMELCKTASSIICSDKINILRDHKQEMLHHIDDIMMWYYSHEKPTKNDYKENIDKINSICDEFVENYGKDGKDLFTMNILTTDIETNSQKLEKLSLTLMTMIKNKQIPGNKAMLVLFTKKIQKNLEFVYTQKDVDNEVFQTECGKNLDELNKMCDEIYNSMQGIDIRHGSIIEPGFMPGGDAIKNSAIVTSELTFITSDNNEGTEKGTGKGTSILEIMRRKQNEEMIDLINQQIEDEDVNYLTNHQTENKDMNYHQQNDNVINELTNTNNNNFEPDDDILTKYM